MSIVAGECEFTTPRPFEARSARVKLSFTVDPGEDVEDVLLSTGAAARSHAYRMINDNVAEEPKRTRAPRAVPPQTALAAAAMEPEHAGTPATDPSPLPASEPEKSISPDPFAGGARAQSERASATGLGTASNAAPPTTVVEITDAMLQDAIKHKVAHDAKHTAGVMELIQVFTGDPLQKIYTVADQAKRAEFMAKLTAL